MLSHRTYCSGEHLELLNFLQLSFLISVAPPIPQTLFSSRSIIRVVRRLVTVARTFRRVHHVVVLFIAWGDVIIVFGFDSSTRDRKNFGHLFRIVFFDELEINFCWVMIQINLSLYPNSELKKWWSKSDHLKSGNIWNPDLIKVWFQTVSFSAGQL